MKNHTIAQATLIMVCWVHANGDYFYLKDSSGAVKGPFCTESESISIEGRPYEVIPLKSVKLPPVHIAGLPFDKAMDEITRQVSTSSPNGLKFNYLNKEGVTPPRLEITLGGGHELTEAIDIISTASGTNYVVRSVENKLLVIYYDHRAWSFLKFEDLVKEVALRAGNKDQLFFQTFVGNRDQSKIMGILDRYALKPSQGKPEFDRGHGAVVRFSEFILRAKMVSDEGWKITEIESAL